MKDLPASGRKAMTKTNITITHYENQMYSAWKNAAYHSVQRVPVIIDIQRLRSECKRELVRKGSLT
jgi:hypothetical protein